jgi:hypothetical protein
MYVRHLIPVLILFAISFSEISGQNLCPKNILPASGNVKGWIQIEPPECFSGDSLFDAIDGGAEIQLEFGFISMARASYSSRKKRLNIEVYCMTKPEAAYGIMTTMNEGPPFKPINGSYSVIKKYYGMLLKGKYFAFIIDPTGKSDLLKDIGKVIASISDRISEDAVTPDIMNSVSKEGVKKAVMFNGDIVLSNYCYLGVTRPFSYKQGIYIETSESKTIVFQCDTADLSDDKFTYALEQFRKTGKYTVDIEPMKLTNNSGVVYSISRSGNQIRMTTAMVK